jgi:hypothetical protein
MLASSDGNGQDTLTKLPQSSLQPYVQLSSVHASPVSHIPLPHTLLGDPDVDVTVAFVPLMLRLVSPRPERSVAPTPASPVTVYTT